MDLTAFGRPIYNLLLRKLGLRVHSLMHKAFPTLMLPSGCVCHETIALAIEIERS